VDVADADAGEEDGGLLFEAADIAGVEIEGVGAMKQAGALAEQDEHGPEQDHGDEYKKSDFSFQMSFFHD
jgi:hypothetical protein